MIPNYIKYIKEQIEMKNELSSSKTRNKPQFKKPKCKSISSLLQSYEAWMERTQTII
jgi:hypothetical protein